MVQLERAGWLQMVPEQRTGLAPVLRTGPATTHACPTFQYLHAASPSPSNCHYPPPATPPKPHPPPPQPSPHHEHLKKKKTQAQERCPSEWPVETDCRRQGARRGSGQRVTQDFGRPPALSTDPPPLRGYSQFPERDVALSPLVRHMAKV
ncbi:unnamed protein product [Arctogadus glacialis]